VRHADGGSVGGGQVAAEDAGAADEGAVALDFPAFDCCCVDCCGPYVADGEDTYGEEGDGVYYEGCDWVGLVGGLRGW
jgi:hypothetical protein